MTIKPDAFLNLLRNIIVDSVGILDDRLVFDGTKAEAAEYDPFDIFVAERIFKNQCYFTDRFKEDLIFYYSHTQLNQEPDFEHIAFYVPVAKIIFVINAKEKVSAYIFEEEFVKGMAILESDRECFETRYTDYDGTRKKLEYRW